MSAVRRDENVEKNNRWPPPEFRNLPQFETRGSQNEVCFTWVLWFFQPEGGTSMTVPSALLSHRSDEHLTPRFILDAVIECLGGIDLDPCSNSLRCPNVPAARHFTREDDGLYQPLEGRVFLNPPFGPGVERWFSKIYQECSAGRTTEAIVLWKSATETSAWKTLTAISCRVCFPSARSGLSVLLAIAAQGRRFHRRCSMLGIGRNDLRGNL